MPRIELLDVSGQFECAFGKRRQGQSLENSRDFRARQNAVKLDALKRDKVGNNSLYSKTNRAQGYIEVRKNVAPIDKVLPGAQLAVCP